MYFSDSRIVASIVEQLNGLSKFVTVVNSLGLTDINKGAEDFFCQLFNHAFGLKLRNLNVLKTNYPAIDLGDEVSRICIQVTSENTSTKLSETLVKFTEHGLSEQYDSLIFLVISDKPLPKVKTHPDVLVEVWGITNLATSVVRNADSDKLNRLNDFLKQNLRSSVESSPSFLPSLIKPVQFSGEFSKLINKMGLRDDPDRGAVVNAIQSLYEILGSLEPEERGMLYLVLKYGKDAERGTGYFGDLTLAPISTVERRVGGRQHALDLYRSLHGFELLSVINDYQPDEEGPYVPVYSAHYYGGTEANLLTEIRKFCSTDDVLLRRVIADGDFRSLC